MRGKAMWLATVAGLSPIGATAQQTGAPAPSAPAPVVAPPAADAGPAAATPSTREADRPVAATPPAATPQTAAAAEATADAGGTSDEPDIIVQGSRNLPGSVVGDIQPEVQLGPADIRAYGVNSIADLLTELAPQTGSGRGAGGPPVVLLNGRRISGFQEISNFPTEAIARVDILPEEVALKYGYRADQRVVNFVLRRRFRAGTVQVFDQIPTEGGRNNAGGEADGLIIARDTRANLHLTYSNSSALTEAERGILFTPGLASTAGNVTVAGGGVVGVPGAAATAPVGLGAFLDTPRTVTDPTPFRTLLGASERFGANATYARPLGQVSASANARLDVNSSRSLNGLPAVTLTLPQGSPFSPFPGAVPVTRALDGDAFSPLTQRNRTLTGHFGTTFNGRFGDWIWSVTGNYDRTENRTFSETGLDAASFQARLDAGDPLANPFGPLSAADIGAAPGNRGRSLTNDAQVDALISGGLFRLPAGPLRVSARAGGRTTDLTSRSFRNGAATGADIQRDIANGQLNVDLPIASAREGFLPWLGRLSLNGNVAVDQLSDFGTLTTVGYGLNWAPVNGVRLLVSRTDDENAPSATQLGNPVIVTPNVRVFDYVRGTTTTVTAVTGGNPNLRTVTAHATKVGLNLRPWSAQDFSISVDYTRNRSDDPIQSFPAATSAIEAAYPDRFQRDAAGTLIRLDTRPVNIARTEQSQLRWGFNFSRPIRSAIQRRVEAFRAGTGPNPFAGMRPPGDRPGRDRPQPGADGAARAQGETPAPAPGDAPPPPPGAARDGAAAPTGAGAGPGGGRQGGGFRGGGGGFGGGRGGSQGRIQFAIYHTWQFTNRQTLADGGPVLDLLNGDANGDPGRSARHRVELQSGYSNNGFRVRVTGNYLSAVTTNGGTPTAPTTLEFGDLATLDLRVSTDLGQQLKLARAHPWVRGARIELGVVNLFNTRQQVTDAAGRIPIGLQPAYRDALGRAVQLTLRKQFF